MQYNEYGPIGMYFDEFEVGMTYRTRGRTISTADIVQFASLTGDFNPIHMNATLSSDANQFGKRVAHGMLSLSYAVGQATQLGFLDQTSIAFREMSTKFSNPVFDGDTIYLELEVKELKALPRLGGGNVIMDVKIVNQDGKIVQKGSWTMLMASKPEGS